MTTAIGAQTEPLPIDERMDLAIAYFIERAATTQVQERRIMLEHLRAIAEAAQQNTRMLDVLKLELETIRQTLGVS